MKHFDDNTKKLIKNVVSLFASALVLVAATIAWFNVKDSNAVGPGFRGSLQSTNSDVDYYRLKDVDDVLTDVTTGTGSAAEFTFAETTPTIPASYLSMNLWDETTSSDGWDIDSLIPGTYDGFRIDVSGNAPLALLLKNITCSALDENETLTAEQLETVYKNVYLYAVAVLKTVDNTTTPPTESYTVMEDLHGDDVIVCDSLYNLLNGKSETDWSILNTQAITTLTTADPAQSTADSKMILMFIGIPGNTVTVDGENDPDLRDEHDALRQIGAQLSIGAFGVSGN